jgi:hypothetical protein
MALTQLKTGAIADDAVTTDKLANAINTERTANTAKVSTTINNNADNRVITGSDTANTLEGEANLSFDGTKLGIGTTSPISTLHLHEAGASGSPIIQFSNGDTGATSGDGFAIGVADNESPFIYNRENTDLRFATNNTEAMRILADGALLVNQTSKQYSDLKFAVTGSNQNLVYFDCAGNGNNYALTIKHGYAYSGSNGIAIRFLNSGGTQAGRIDIGQSTVGYETSSDYRLKENVEAISDGITRLKTLKPYRFNWKEEKGQPKVDGFFAHEVTSAVPEAISGTKDEVDSDKNPVYQGIDQSKLVPLLTAALQEAIAKIEVLETKVAALEAA